MILKLSIFFALIAAFTANVSATMCQDAIFDEISAYDNWEFCYFDGNSVLQNCTTAEGGGLSEASLMDNNLCSAEGTAGAGFATSGTCDNVIYRMTDVMMTNASCDNIWGNYTFDLCSSSSDCMGYMFENHTSCVVQEYPDSISRGTCNVGCTSDADCACYQTCRSDSWMSSEYSASIDHPAGSSATGVCVDTKKMYQTYEEEDIDTLNSYWSMGCYKNSNDGYCFDYVDQFQDASTPQQYCGIVSAASCCYDFLIEFLPSCEPDDPRATTITQLATCASGTNCDVSGAELPLDFTCSSYDDDDDMSSPSWLNSPLVLGMIVLSSVFFLF